MKEEREALKYLHMAAQYLSAAGKSFLKHNDDDSHTTMQWDADEQTLFTDALNEEGLRLGLNMGAFALDFHHPLSGLEASYPLTGARHFDVVNWIERERAFCGLNGQYTFDLHYELPYEDSFADGFHYPRISGTARDKLSTLRDKAQTALQSLVAQAEIDSKGKVQVWPHHFDTGLVISHKARPNLTFSLGLAMPDSLSDQWYFYLSAYQGEQVMAVSDITKLSKGLWLNEGFTGAILGAELHTSEQATQFFSEAIESFE